MTCTANRCSAGAAALAAALSLALLGATSAQAAKPPGKLVKQKTVEVTANSRPTEAAIRFNPGWRGPGRGIKKATVRFSAGGNAFVCRTTQVFNPQTDAVTERKTCRGAYKVAYSYGASCTTRGMAVPSIGRSWKKEVPRSASPASPAFTFTKVQPARLVRGRVSCEIGASIGVDLEEIDDDRELSFEGKARLKVELFIKK